MSKSLTITKFATNLAAIFLVSIFNFLFFSIGVIAAPFLAIRSAYKISASLYNTQSLPRLQQNRNLLSGVSFFPVEFVDTGKNFSKSAKVFLSIGVGAALIILFPFIILFHISAELYCVVRDVFEEVKNDFREFTGAGNPAMQSEGKEKRSLDSPMFSENFVDLAKGRVPELFEECRNVVTHIKAKYSDSELEKSEIKGDIDKIDSVLKVYFEKHQSGNFSFNKDVNLDELKASLKRVVSFVKSSGEHFDFSLERLFVIKSYTTVDTFFQYAESLRIEEDKLSAEPSKKLDGANQSPVVGVSQSSILK